MTNYRNDKLTWGQLMIEYSEVASAEAIQPAMSTVKFGKGKDKDKKVDGDKPDNKDNNDVEKSKKSSRRGRPKSKCAKCDTEIDVTFVHYDGYAKHLLTGKT